MIQEEESLKKYLKPTEFLNCDNEKVISFVNDILGNEKDKKKAILKLFYKIRDSIPYQFDSIDISKEIFIASNVIGVDGSFCIPKAVLLATSARVIGIPSRLGFADVKNHLATEKVLKKMQTDLFIFHGYAELYLNDKWLKATPAFNKELCQRFNVKPLDFDGENDSLFQQFTESGDKYMDYLKDYGSFADMPYELMLTTFKNAYPHWYAELKSGIIEESD
ncbi:MAG: transglutaminase-like domain-containing protein [Ignavibacteria bacterium]|jgi:transglutaminase-like putative cysteine protease